MTEFPNDKGIYLFGLLWFFVNTNPITLMEQLKNIPSMFHHNIRYWKIQIPANQAFAGICFVGCPDGLEPSTFRTTI